MFEGDKTKARAFIGEWDRYWSLNYQSNIMHVPYSRAMMFLTYIKGPRMIDWTDMMTRNLNLRVQNGANPNAEELWTHVYESFR